MTILLDKHLPQDILRDYPAEHLIKSINVWGNVCDSELNMLVWNPTAERISGYPAEEVIGHARVWEWLYPDEAERNRIFGLVSTMIFEDGSIRELETQILCKDHSLKTIAWYSRPLTDNSGQVQGFATFGYDVTDRNLAEHALQKAHSELHVLYEIASLTNEVKSLDVILERSLERILVAMKSAGGTVHLWDDVSQQLVSVAAKGVEVNAYPAINFVRSVYDAGLPTDAAQTASTGYIAVPMRAKGRIYGVISVLVNPDMQLSQDDIALLTSIADQIGIAVENARLYEQSKQLAVSEDRRRLARDLHDSVTQSLYSLTLFAEAGQRLLRTGDLERVDKYLDRLNKTAQDALREMRLLLYELRPLAFESGKLVDTLQQRLDAVERRSGLSAHLITQPLPPLSTKVQDGIYHIILEALNNTLKHSRSPVVTVALSEREGGIELTVNDNGVGFSYQPDKISGGMGLNNMRERAEELGGALTIESSPNHGTRVCAFIPIEQ